MPRPVPNPPGERSTEWADPAPCPPQPAHTTKCHRARGLCQWPAKDVPCGVSGAALGGGLQSGPQCWQVPGGLAAMPGAPSPASSPSSALGSELPQLCPCTGFMKPVWGGTPLSRALPGRLLPPSPHCAPPRGRGSTPAFPDFVDSPRNVMDSGSELCWAPALGVAASGDKGDMFGLWGAGGLPAG